MFFLAGVAAGSALDYLSSLKQLVQPSQAGGNGQAPNPFSTGNNTQNAVATPTSSGSLGISSETLNTLLSAQSQASASTTPALTPDQSQVFAALDSNGDGQLNQSEFEKLFGASNKSVADAIFAKIDTNGDGTVSQSELAAGLKQGSEKAQEASAGAGSSSSQGDKSQSITNADGSTTTTITYPDGSQVSMTTPAAASAGTNAVANNMLEQLIQRQAQSLMSSVGQSVSMNV
jgi:Ca2+-binding EF-hand superfamily protein